MINKTKKYDMFIFRNDNREKIDQGHVNKLTKSIQARNLLEMRPIDVNADMEIIDGQHRLLAAQKLGVAIYYQVKEDLKISDIITLNTAKNWGNVDFLNYFVKNGYPEYIKLKKFMDDNEINLRVAMAMIIGKGQQGNKTFRAGEMKFEESPEKEYIEICWETVNRLKKVVSSSKHYLMASKFWTALLKIVMDIRFNKEKWFSNLMRMSERFCPKASTADYYKMMLDVHNWKNSQKINMEYEGDEQ